MNMYMSIQTHRVLKIMLYIAFTVFLSSYIASATTSMYEIGTTASTGTTVGNLALYTPINISALGNYSNTLLNMSVNIQTAAGNGKFAIYSGNASAPIALITNTTNFTLTTGWNNYSLVAPLSAGTYYLAMEFSSNATVIYRSLSGSVYYHYQTFGTFPTTPATLTPSTQTYNMRYGVNYLNVTNVIDIIQSDNVKYSNDSEVFGFSTTLTKVNQIVLTENYSGSWKIAFDLRAYPAFSAYGRIYKNGAAIGTLQTTSTSTSWVTFTQTFTNVSLNNTNDLIEMYLNTTSGVGNPSRIRNFRIYFDYDYENYIPTLTYPANNSVVTSTFPPFSSPVNFTWTNIGSSGYNIMVCEDINCNIITSNQTSTTPYLSIDLPADVYYWKVRTYNTGIASGAWSSIFTFTLSASVPSLTGTHLNGIVYEMIGGTQVPISGASIYLTNTTSTMGATTGSNGYYQFDNVVNTTYTIYAKKQGYDTTDVAYVTPIYNQTLTYNILMRIYISPYIPNFVFEKFVVKSLFDQPYPGVTINIYDGSALTPSFTVTTDSMGQAVVQLVKDKYYRVELSGGSLTSTLTVYIYAKDEEYVIAIANGFPTTQDKYSKINYSLSVNTINSTWSNLTLNYNDTLGSTTNISFYARNLTTNATCYVFSSDAVATLNCSVIARGSYQFGFNATSTVWGKFYQDKVVNFNAGNPSAPQPSSLQSINATTLNWISILLIIFVASMFSIRNVKHGAVVVPLVAAVLWGLGALNVSWTFIVIALVIGVMVYVRMSEVKVTY